MQTPTGKMEIRSIFFDELMSQTSAWHPTAIFMLLLKFNVLAKYMWQIYRNKYKNKFIFSDCLVQIFVESAINQQLL